MYDIKKRDFGCSASLSQNDEGCKVDLALQLISGKWKGIILYLLKKDELRFNQLQHLMPTISHRVLALQLKELEEVNIIKRTVYEEKPPQIVGYSLTAFGLELIPLVEQLQQVGDKFLQQQS